MEEDIKVLEKLQKVFAELRKDDEEGHSSAYELQWEDIQAIENLIARNKELEEVVKTYNAIPNDYMGNDIKIVIADREYFNDGILKENLIPKSKVQEILDEYGKQEIEDITVIRFYKAIQNLVQEGDK